MHINRYEFFCGSGSASRSLPSVDRELTVRIYAHPDGFSASNEGLLLLCLCRLDADWVACCSLSLLLRDFGRDFSDLARDGNRLKRVRCGESFQKLLDLRGFVVFDNHINLSLAR